MNTPPGEAATPRQAGGAGRRWLRRPAAAGMLVIGFLATGLLVASDSLVHFSPVGIRGAVPSGPEGERAAGRMMSKASSLAAGLDRPGDWGEAFTDAEANAWLSIDLPHHAPGLLEGGISSPQVRFLDRRAACSALVQFGPLSAQLWAILEVTVRSDNLLAVGVDSAGLGAVPLPPGTVLRAIAARAEGAGAATEIRLLDGGPLLLVQLPGRTKTTSDERSEYHLGGVRITPGELVLAGTTRSLPR